MSNEKIDFYFESDIVVDFGGYIFYFDSVIKKPKILVKLNGKSIGEFNLDECDVMVKEFCLKRGLNKMIESCKGTDNGILFDG